MLALVTAALAMAAPVASAVMPISGARYSGKGEDYLNNAPKWRASASEAVSFKVSANRRRLVGFKGRFFYYCGSRTATLSAAYIDVTRAGTFDYRFTQQTPSGGADYAEIKGRFVGSGNSAQLSYLVDYSEGKKISQPYSTANPGALGCASWTRATVRAG